MKYSKRRAKKLARQLKLDGYQDYRALAKGLRLSKIGGSVIATITALGLLSSLSVVFGVLAIVGGIVAFVTFMAWFVMSVESEELAGFWTQLAEYRSRKRHGLIPVPTEAQYDILTRLHRLSIDGQRERRHRDLFDQLKRQYRELGAIGPDDIGEIEEFSAQLEDMLRTRRELEQRAEAARKEVMSTLTPAAIRDR